MPAPHATAQAAASSSARSSWVPRPATSATHTVVSAVTMSVRLQPGPGAARTTSGHASALYSQLATCSDGSLSSKARMRLRVGPSSATTKTQTASTAPGMASVMGAWAR